MKQYMKYIIIYLMIVGYFFMSLPFYVYASEHGGGGGSDHNSDFITDAGTINVKDDGVVMYYIEYILAQIGAIISDHDLTKAMANDQTMKEYISKGKFDANTKTVVFPKETVVYVKQQFEKYAKEHEPYFMVNTYTLDDLLGSEYAGGKLMYDTAKNLLNDSPSGVIVFGAAYDHPEKMFFADIGNEFRNISPIRLYENDDGIIHFYDNESWNRCSFKVYKYEADKTSEAVKTAAEFIENATYTYNYGFNINNPIGYAFKVCPIGYVKGLFVYDCRFPSSRMILLSKEARRIRVFNTYGDFQNYTLGKRSVYYTSNYYNYVPDDITVSIDDLEKAVDDLQKVIDELLKQIQDNTDESEIEELLRQILEAIRNQQGTGGGGSGSGDVTVNVDLSTTNNWLSKIYSKVSQIYDKISSSAGQSMSEVVESIENLKQMLKTYLSEITGDLDDIKGQLEEMTEEEFSEKTESFLDDTLDSFSEISEKAKGKFPFSIPNDIRLLITKMSVSLPEDPDQGTYSVQTMSFDAAYESNGLITVMDEGVGDVPVISETGAPIFYIPFVIASAGIEEYVLIDLSGFESISSFCRSLMTIYFILCLFNLTFKVMGLWGDLVD